MKILITGATGFIGGHLLKGLGKSGHELVVLTRNRPSAKRRVKVPCEIIEWNFERDAFPVASLEGVTAVINLAGESLADGRWNASKLKRIHDSRVLVTRELVRALSSMPVKVFISSSAVGYYGNGGDRELFESDPPGTDFLARVCRDWEKEALEAPASVRTVVLRTGIVLGSDGGVLAQLVKPFEMGLGTVVGSGNQWLSWIHVDDWVSLVEWALRNDKVRGPINAVGPRPAQNKEFSKVLSHVLGKPLLLKTPASVFRVMLGKKSQLVLDGQKVSSHKVEELGFHFKHVNLQPSLEDILDLS